MRLIIGCPIRDRAWIIERWFEHVKNALLQTGIADVQYVFVADTDKDPTVAEILRIQPDSIILHSSENVVAYKREWDKGRYQRMAALRNQLLGYVREAKPDLYWSLDSDILVADDALALAIDGLHKFDAVGSKCFLSSHQRAHPNYANLSSTGNLLRSDVEGLCPVQVLMAAKLMTQPAYNVDYVMHKQGEDIGWSKNAHKAGVTLGFDGRTCSKHVMAHDQLDAIDKRCGF